MHAAPEGSFGVQAPLLLQNSIAAQALSLLQKPGGSQVIEAATQLSLRHSLALLHGPSPAA